MSELKPCPFCGGNVKAVKSIFSNGFVYVCNNKSCGADVMFFAGDNKDRTKNDALWSRRSIDIDELLAIADKCDAADVDTDWAKRIRKVVGA